MLYLLLPLPRNEQLDKKIPFFLLLFIEYYYSIYIIINKILKIELSSISPFATQTAGTLSGSQWLKRAGALYLLAMPVLRL